MSEENLNQSGLQFTTNKEGLKEATWEGDFFQRSDVETKDKGMDNDPLKQIPIVSSIATLADGIVPAVGEYVEKGKEYGFFSKEAAQGGMQQFSEYVLKDIQGSGLGRSVSRTTFKAGRDFIQQPANVGAAMLDPNRKLSDGDVGILWGEPLADVETNAVEGFIAEPIKYIMMMKAAKYAFAPLMKIGAVSKGIAGAKGFFDPKVAAILNGAKTKAGNIPFVKNPRLLPKWVPFLGGKRAQEIAAVSGLKTLEGLAPGFVYDTFFWEPQATGEWQDDGSFDFYTGNGFFKIDPDDSYLDAVGVTRHEGALVGTFMNHAFPVGKAIARRSGFVNQVVKRRNGMNLAKIKNHIDNGGEELTSVIEKAGNGDKKAIKTLRVLNVFQENTEVPIQERLINDEMFQRDVQGVLELEGVLKNDPVKAERIIADTPTDVEMIQSTIETGKALEKAGLELKKSEHMADATNTNIYPNPWDGDIRKPEIANTEIVDIADIDVKPEEFQFKEAGQFRTEGDSGTFTKDQKAFDDDLAQNINVWRDPATDRYVVVNGHNRLALAKKLGRSQVRILEVQAANATEARTIGALQNIADDKGTAIDAAKIFRDPNATQMASERGIDLTGSQASKGLALSRLPNEIFTQIATGKSTVERGIALASVPDVDPAVMRDVWISANKGRKWSAEVIEQAMNEAKFSVTTEGQEGFLKELGMDMKSSDWVKRSRVRSVIFKKLGNKVTALTQVAKGGAAKEILEEAGNTVEVLGSRAQRAQALAVKQRFNEVLNYKGPVRDLLEKIVGETKDGESLQAIEKRIAKYLKRIEKAIDKELVQGKKDVPASPRKVRQTVREQRVVDTPDDKLIRNVEETKATEPQPLSTAITKVPKTTPVTKFLRLAPEGDQAEIALNRLVVAMNKFSDGAKGNAGAIDTVGDLINLLNIARVATEETVQKALRDIEKTIVFLQSPNFKLPGTKKILTEARAIRKMQAEVKLQKQAKNKKIKALGKEPLEGDPNYDTYWAKRDKIENEMGVTKDWKDVIEDVNEADKDTPGFLSGELELPNVHKKVNLGTGHTNRINDYLNIRKQLRDEVRRITGQDVDFELLDTIEGRLDKAQAAAYGAKEGDTFSAFGMYQPKELTGEIDDIVMVAMNSGGKRMTLSEMVQATYHEAFHRLQIRYLTPRELLTLQGADKELRKLAAQTVTSSQLKKDILSGVTSSNEVQAMAFQGWYLTRDRFSKATWNEPFEKIAEIVQAVKRYLEGKSLNTFDDIFENAYEGDFPQRGEVTGKARMEADKIINKQRQSLASPNGPMLAVNNTRKTPDMGDEDESFARRFAEALRQNEDKLKNGEVTRAELWAQNKYQKVRSRSGKYVYNSQAEDLIAGMEAMGRAELDTRAGLSGIPKFDGITVQRHNHQWYKKRGADGAGILRGLSELTKGFYKYENGALNRAQDFADKLQFAAQAEAAKWNNSVNNPTIDKRVQLARLIVAADSSRRMNRAIMKVTRPWGQLGQEMQLPRDIDTYSLPDNYKLPDIDNSIDDGIAPPQGSYVDNAIKEELKITPGTNPALDETAGAFVGLRDALETGKITPDAQAAADEIADNILIAGASPASADKIWSGWQDLGKRETAIKGFEIYRSSNLISGGMTAGKGLFNGMFNLSALTLEQSIGGAISGDMDRALYSLQLYGNYWNNLRHAFRNAAIGFQTGRPMGNLDKSSIDALGKVAQKDAQGELISESTRTGWSINTMDMDAEYAKTLPGQVQNHLWRALGTLGGRMAVTIDSFNSTVAGWSYEYFRHMPRGMELAVEKGLKKNSKEAFEEAFAYAQKRTDSAVKAAVIDGKTITEATMDSPFAQRFADAVNFTDDLMATMDKRTLQDGMQKGKARGLKDNELLDFAKDYVEHGNLVQRIANRMTSHEASQDLLAPGRWGSVPSILLARAREFPVVGPVAKFMVPFMKVPTNIFKAYLVRSTIPGTPIPGAIFVDTWWRDVASSDPGTRQRALGAMATGNAAMQLLTGASAFGFLRFNGGGPVDYAAKQKWLRERQMPYSVQTWNEEQQVWDAPVSMEALEPYATMFGAIGDYNDAQAMMTDEERSKAAAALSFDILRLSLAGQLDKTYFRGINELVEAAFDPSKIYTGPNRRGALQKYLQRQGATLVPLASAFKQGRYGQDSVVRTVEPSTNESPVMAYWEEQWATIKNGLAGYSEDNPAIVDWTAPGAPPVEAPSMFFTKELAENHPWMASMLQYVPLVNAFRRGKMITDPVALNLANLHGKGTAFLGPTASDFGSDQYLTPTELNDYRRIFATVRNSKGLTWHQEMTKLVTSNYWKKPSMDESPRKGEASYKALDIQDLISDFKEIAKKEFQNTTSKGQLILQGELQEAERELKRKALKQNTDNVSQFTEKVSY